MDRGGWWPTVHGVAKSQTRLTQLSTQSSLGEHIQVLLAGKGAIHPDTKKCQTWNRGVSSRCISWQYPCLATTHLSILHSSYTFKRGDGSSPWPMMGHHGDGSGLNTDPGPGFQQVQRRYCWSPGSARDQRSGSPQTAPVWSSAHGTGLFFPSGQRRILWFKTSPVFLYVCFCSLPFLLDFPGGWSEPS